MGTRKTVDALNYGHVARMPNKELEVILHAGRGPAPEVLAGYEWRGWNRPARAALLGMQKFIKGFFILDGRVEGYNIRVRQNAFEEPWIYRPDPDHPRRFGFYTVAKVNPASRDNLYPEATLLDYRASTRNVALDPARFVYDYIVQADYANPDLMIGKAYLVFGSIRIFSNFFLLERLRPTDWKP